MSVFLTIPHSNWVFDTDHFFAIYDKYPTSEGHMLLISKGLSEDFFGLNEIERIDLLRAIQIGKDILDKRFKPSGYNIGMNCGKVAGQSVWHCHVHLIPRRQGDAPYPKGGVRHVIPYKGNYEDLK